MGTCCFRPAQDSGGEDIVAGSQNQRQATAATPGKYKEFRATKVEHTVLFQLQKSFKSFSVQGKRETQTAQIDAKNVNSSLERLRFLIYFSYLLLVMPVSGFYKSHRVAPCTEFSPYAMDRL